MNFKDYYAPGTYNDPDAPWNQVDPTETAEFEKKQREIWDENIMDVDGYFTDSILERPYAEREKLAMLVRDNQNGTHTEAIGAMITAWVLEGCKPSDDDVIEALEPDGGF